MDRLGERESGYERTSPWLFCGRFEELLRHRAVRPDKAIRLAAAAIDNLAPIRALALRMEKHGRAQRPQRKRGAGLLERVRILLCLEPLFSLRYAFGCSLIAIGSHGRRSFRALLAYPWVSSCPGVRVGGRRG